MMKMVAGQDKQVRSPLASKILVFLIFFKLIPGCRGVSFLPFKFIDSLHG
jgi:hypothetical protein